MNWRSLLLSLVLFVPRALAGASAGDVIAHYRFDTNGNDSLGRSPPFVVTNGDQSRAGVAYTAAFAVPNAPFPVAGSHPDRCRRQPGGCPLSVAADTAPSAW